MKNFLLSSSLILGAFGLNAQTIVSTSPEDRNIVLEEYTGIYCQFCPDGHVRANQLAADNPGRVVLINIHQGGYANPSGTDPDYRTQWGDDLAGQTNLAGYPVGTVNRHEFSGMSQNGTGTAMSRGDWATAGATILTQGSPVNVAVDASLDISTRELTVLVEAYITDMANFSTGKLNVALLQDGLKGPQTGATTWNPTNIDANGDYTHNHMLRHLLTGQWGEDINSTGGAFITKTYTYTLPNDINGIPFSLNELSVAAFVAEGQQEIVTGVVQHVALPSNVKTELGVANMTSAPSDYCATSVTPTLSVTNNHSTTITSFDVSYTLNGGTAVVESYSGSLTQGQSTTITFPAVTLASGENIIAYQNVSNINNGTLIDTNTANVATGNSILTVPANAISTPKTEGFESANIGDFPAGVFVSNPTGARVYTVDQTINTSLANPLGGYAASAKSVRFDYYAINAAEEVSFFFEKLDFDAIDTADLMFDYSHASYTGSEPDELDVAVSTDCGATWSSLWNKVGSTLATAPAVGTARYYPQAASEWTTETIDLDSYAQDANVTELLVRFKGVSGFGNSLYLDNINIVGGVDTTSNPGDTSGNPGDTTSVIDLFVNNSVNIFPNPATDEVNVNFELINASDVAIRIYDVTGKVVYSNTNSYVVGRNNERINVSELPNGMYYMDLVSGEAVNTKRLVISK